MKHLFVIITNSRNKPEIDFCKSSWLEKEDHVFLGDTHIDELNMIGFDFDSGVSHEINHRLYYFFEQKKELLKKYNWVTFLDDSSYVFIDRLYNSIEKRLDGRIPRILGNDYFTQCDFFNTRQVWGKITNGSVFNLKNGISINSSFIEGAINLFKKFKNDEENIFLNEILLDDMFFHIVSEKIGAKKHLEKNRVFINYYDNIEAEFNSLDIISGLNSVEKNIIKKNKK